MTVRLHRYEDADALASGVATRLLCDLVSLQAADRLAQLCLTGGRIANHMYHRFADQAPASELDPARLELWWGDERFLPSGHADRNAGPTLEILGTLGLSPALTHSLPGSDGVPDGASAAQLYAKELGATVFDICLLGMGPDGHVASIFPDHPSGEPTSLKVIEVTGAPKPPPDRISLSLPTLNRSTEIWFLIAGGDKAEAAAQAVRGDESIPAGRARGTKATRFFIDAAAGSLIECYECRF